MRRDEEPCAMSTATIHALPCPIQFRPNGDWGPFIEEDGVLFQVSFTDPGAEYFERSDAWDCKYLVDPDHEVLGITASIIP
jgi:hypothetical protein